MPDSPEALFRLLRPTDPRIAFLWSHQADILRDYARTAATVADVALELPTGAGKTLVGLLIAEYRRRALRQRVVILCPTRHLARQVGDKAAGYGLRAHVFVGKQREWPDAEFMGYERASAIAITTYASVFNTSPRLGDAQTLILDDAHAAEGPVADLWSLVATRGDGLYEVIRDLVDDFVPAAFAERLHEDTIDPRDRRAIEIVGPQDLAARAPQLREAFAANATGNAGYAATMIEDQIGCCVLYASWDTILVRPFVVPSRTHDPFARASQRVYMSATLGDGGELERSFGVPKITRLPVPEGWKDHGSGRRFFMFPSVAVEPDEADEFIRSAVDEAGRAVIIASSTYELGQVIDLCLPPGIEHLTAADIENDRDALARANRAALLLTRYDGMDFPDEDCRLVVLSGLPSTGHLQERFLYEHLGAHRVLSERIRARVVQGAGRCTRNAKDFAAVIVRGASLTEFLSRRENLISMQPELQAEIDFGMRNADTADAPDFLGDLRSFLDQDEDWVQADDDIVANAAELQREPFPDSVALTAASALEVEAWQVAWTGDLLGASGLARQVADALEGGAALRPYRCFWLYLAGSWAKAGAMSDADRERAEAFMAEAVACGRHLSWRPRIDRESIPRTSEQPTARAERAAQLMAEVGLRGRRFEREAQTVLAGLTGREAVAFEMALARLGEYLGFESERPGGQGAPDGVWRDVDDLWVVFEAKTEGDPDLPISATDVRQANGHIEWVRTQRRWPEPAHSVSALITDRSQAVEAAASVAGRLMAVPQATILGIAQDVFEAHRALRVLATGDSAETIAATFTREFRERGLDTDSITLHLSEQGVARLPPPGR